jgi:mono/diheme cytochrome c family protein
MALISYLRGGFAPGCSTPLRCVFLLLLACCSATPSLPEPILPPLIKNSACPQDFDAGQLQLGQKVYTRVCMACHQNAGQGLKGIFPPLAGHAPRLANTLEGRRYLSDLVLWGMTGGITVDGTAYQNLMPAQHALLQDEEIAAVLTYVMYAWDNCRFFTVAPHFATADVAQQRQAPQAADAVYQRRGRTKF